MSESQQQIARSRAKSLLADGKWRHDHYSDAEMEDVAERVVLSAIERATGGHKYDEEGECEVCGQTRECHPVNVKTVTQPQRSEQQEWTPKYVEKLVGVQARRIDYTRIAQRIADAHNAALTAERRLREQAEGAAHHMEACRALLGVPEDEVLYQAIKDLHNQLLSALAVIASHNKQYEGCSLSALSAIKQKTGREPIINVDLSLLHEHDAEVLNEVVRLLASIFLGNGRSWNIPPKWSLTKTGSWVNTRTRDLVEFSRKAR